MKTITPQRAEKIARNINAMNLSYEYCDDYSKWSFWSDLKQTLNRILKTLSDADKSIIVALCEETKAKYFGLI